MKQPSLTIVIPAYNEAANLSRCLDAIADQATAPDQVIVVDNNSTDQTAEIARRYNFVTLISEPRQGISYAHHAGFEHATTDLIARIDADTRLPRTWVQQVLAFYDNHDLSTTLAGTGSVDNLPAPQLTGLIIRNGFRLMKLLLGHNPLWGPNFVVPRKVWLQVAPQICFDAAFDDLDLSLHLHALNLPVVLDPRLRVGAQLRHSDTMPDFWRYCMRWTDTLRTHAYAQYPIRAKISLIVTAVMFPGHYLIIKILRLIGKPQAHAA